MVTDAQIQAAKESLEADGLCAGPDEVERALQPQQPAGEPEYEPLKIEHSKEWWLEKTLLEEGHEVSAGLPERAKAFELDEDERVALQVTRSGKAYPGDHLLLCDALDRALATLAPTERERELVRDLKAAWASEAALSQRGVQAEAELGQAKTRIEELKRAIRSMQRSFDQVFSVSKQLDSQLAELRKQVEPLSSYQIESIERVRAYHEQCASDEERRRISVDELELLLSRFPRSQPVETPGQIECEAQGFGEWWPLLTDAGKQKWEERARHARKERVND